MIVVPTQPSLEGTMGKHLKVCCTAHQKLSIVVCVLICTSAAMGGATVGQWGQLVPIEIRLWRQNYVIAPTEIKRARTERYL